MTAAARFYGASLMGYAEMDSTWRNKLVLKYSRSRISGTSYVDYKPWPPPDTIQKPYVYEDVDRAYEGDAKLVIPNKQMYVVSSTVHDSPSMTKATTARFAAIS